MDLRITDSVHTGIYRPRRTRVNRIATVVSAPPKCSHPWLPEAPMKSNALSPPLLLALAGLALPALLAFASCVDVEDTTPAVVPPDVPAIAPRPLAPRLSVAQYRNVVHDLFGEDVAVPPALEPDTSTSGFVSVGSAQSAISPRGVEQYEEAAFKIAEQALATPAKRAALVPCEPASPTDEACARAFVEKLGRRAWRRPLADEEVTAIAGVVTKAGGTLGDFHKGAEFGIAALLEAPSFLYRPVLGEPDPDHPGSKRATAHEMASRLSFFLWNSTPDSALLDAADTGALLTDAGIEEQVRRLLDDPRARGGLRNFVTEYLRLDQLDTLSKDPTVFTYYSPDIGPAAREETLLDFERAVFDRDLDYRDLFTTRTTFVNPKLASMYEVLAPDPEGFAEVELPADIPRRGLLGQVSILALYAHPTSSSATLRGKLVRTVLLCGEIPPPPADVNTALPEPEPGAVTLRDREKAHLADSFCAGCHLRMDPIGLGLENFDGIGRYRTKDHGALIDASGDLDGVTFKDSLDLSNVVATHPDLPGCFTRRMYEYATSSVETFEEEKVITALTAHFQASGHKVKALMATIAQSRGFRLVGEAQ